jgi:RimJ/RimL family protein N-acetyltransferase
MAYRIGFGAKWARSRGWSMQKAPNGELGWAESPVSPEEYASEIELWIAQGHTVFESIAVDAHGNVAAWTCLLAADETNRPALIEGTLVVTAHRGRALGRAIKIACLNEAGGRNNVQKVRTSSDDENV